MFNPVFVIANNLDELWFELLKKNYEFGRRYKITSGSYAGAERVELDFAAGWVKDPHVRPLAPVVPSGVPVPTTDDAIVNYFSLYIMDPVLAVNEEYKYSTWINGQMLEYPKYCKYIKCEHLKEDYICSFKKPFIIENSIYEKICPDYENKPNTQLDWVIRHFKKSGYGNNHCYISVGDRYSCLAYDRSFNNESERGTSPCLRGIDFKIKDNTLITSVVFRSWDLYSGLPENLGGITLLNEYVASCLEGVSPGPIGFSSSGLHCYDFQLEYRNSRINK